MEFLVLYFFVMIERFGALLSLGWGFFWLGFGIIGLCIVVSAINIQDAGFSGTHRVRSFTDTFDCQWSKGFRKVGKWFAIGGLILGSLSYLVPSQKDLAIIAGGGITYQAVTSETGKRIGGKAISLLEQKIDSVLSDKMPDTPKADTPKPNKQAL